MISSRPLVSSLAASLARCDLQASISEAVASPRRRIDFSRFISSRLESSLISFAGGLVSVEVAMKAVSLVSGGTPGRSEVCLSSSDRLEHDPRRLRKTATPGRHKLNLVKKLWEQSAACQRNSD